MGREQLAAYDVTIHDEEVVEVTPREKAFTENRDRRLAAYAPADAGSATAWPSTKTT